MNNELNFLVVEDNPVDAKAVCRILSRTGMAQSTDQASSMEQAKEKIRKRSYDAVILDLGLPDSQGIDGVIEFQATAPEVPVVVLTGLQDEQTALMSMEIGAEDFLNKDSMTVDSLCRSVRNAIERHRRKRETYRDIDSLRHSLSDAMQQAHTDLLTGLPNRRALELHLEQLSKSSPSQPFIAAVADLDHFKGINDRYGHDVGDSVLREFASRLQHCLRPHDFAARVGGDEFVIMFWGLNHAEAAGLGRRIISHISSSPVAIGGSMVSFSATMAMAELEAPYLDLEQILHQTHRLLAQGKKGGRSRLECGWDSEGHSADKLFTQLPAEESAESDFSDGGLLQHPRSIRGLGPNSQQGWHLLFGIGPASWPMAAPAISRARIAKRLSQMTLACMRRARAWWLEQEPGSQLHLDIEADAIKPWVCTQLTKIFPLESERKNCVLFLHSDFSRQPGTAYLADLRMLRHAGFKIGVRNIGDGSTILEHLQLLAPDWLRLDPALTINVSRYEKKAEALRLMVAMLAPLKAQLLADETELGEDLAKLEELGFKAYYTEKLKVAAL